MMVAVEIARALGGLWRLINLDPRGLDFFDRTIDGFWRSFRVALYVLPAYALLIPAQLMAERPTASWGRVMIVELLTYIVGWLAFPVIAWELCRRFDRSAAYIGYIVVYNWSAFLAVALALVVSTVHLTGFLSPGFLGLLGLAAYAAWLGYLWFVTKLALNVDGLVATALVVLEFVLSEVLQQVSFYMER